MPDALDPKEAKTLSDILALVLDTQPGPAAVALDKLRARAEADRVTGGALKNIFMRVAVSRTAPPPPMLAELATLRDAMTVQAASIRHLQQEVRIARSALDEAVEERDDLEGAVAGRRLVFFLGLVVGTVIGGGAGGGLAWHLLRPVPSVAANNLPTVTPWSPGAIVVVPPARDPSDTAPPPQYPAEAKERGEEGTVSLVVHIDADGQVTAIGVAQSAGATLDVAAQQAVREWHFRPETRDGKAVASQLMLRFTFALKK